ERGEGRVQLLVVGRHCGATRPTLGGGFGFRRRRGGFGGGGGGEGLHRRRCGSGEGGGGGDVMGQLPHTVLQTLQQQVISLLLEAKRLSHFQEIRVHVSIPCVCGEDIGCVTTDTQPTSQDRQGGNLKSYIKLGFMEPFRFPPRPQIEKETPITLS